MTGEGRPDVATLLDWIEGRLGDEESAAVAEQMADADERTWGTVDWLRGFLGTAAALPLHDPPPVVRQNLNQHFARWRQARAVLEQTARIFSASLTFDSRRDLDMAGARAADVSEAVFNLAYTADPADLVLDVRRLGRGRVQVDGQVLTPDPGSAPIFQTSVRGEHFEARTVDGDELGRFSLPDVPDDVRELRTTNGEITIIADLDLRS